MWRWWWGGETISRCAVEWWWGGGTISRCVELWGGPISRCVEMVVGLLAVVLWSGGGVGGLLAVVLRCFGWGLGLNRHVSQTVVGAKVLNPAPA